MDADKRENTSRSHHRTHPSDHTSDHTSDQPGSARSATTDAATQLQLLEADHLPDWRLDPSTKAIGIHGIAQARAALRTARRRRAELEPGDAHSGRATAA